MYSAVTPGLRSNQWLFSFLFSFLFCNSKHSACWTTTVSLTATPSNTPLIAHAVGDIGYFYIKTHTTRYMGDAIFVCYSKCSDIGCFRLANVRWSERSPGRSSMSVVDALHMFLTPEKIKYTASKWTFSYITNLFDASVVITAHNLCENFTGTCILTRTGL